MDFYPSLYDGGAEVISFSSSRKCGKSQAGFFDCGAEIVIRFVLWDFTKFNVVACILRESFASVKTELSAPVASIRLATSIKASEEVCPKRLGFSVLDVRLHHPRKRLGCRRC